MNDDHIHDHNDSRVNDSDLTPEQHTTDDSDLAPHESVGVTMLDNPTPDTPWQKIVNWSKEHRAAAAGIGAAILVAVAGGGYEIYEQVKGPDESITAKRPWMDDVGQRNLPEAKVIPGAQPGSLTTLDHLPSGETKNTTAVVEAIDAQGGESGATLTVPEDISHVGYYVRSAPFGNNNKGTTVLTSHIDYAGKIGFGTVFTSLKKDDPITLTSGDGKEHHYVVSEDPQQVDKQDPEYVKKTQDTINRMSGPSELIMVTCGGEFLPDSPLGYAKNTIVRAHPVDALEIKDASK